LARKRNWVRWYDLPEPIRKQLISVSPNFFGIRDYVSYDNDWDYGHGDDRAIMVQKHGWIFWDTLFPQLVKLYNSGVKVAIYPANIGVLHIQFILPKETSGGAE